MKLTVGLYTNSLAILSEALHSCIDLIAAVMTFFAVKAASRPPDADHMFGHEKFESLSSLGETLLLFVTCIWIVYEAIDRLFLGGPQVTVGPTALIIMLISVAIDFTRSRALHRTALKYKSQALEADAVHFSTDLISSAIVIAGILLDMAGFKEFDAISALGVAAVTVVIGLRLGKKSIYTLLDGAPGGVSRTVSEEALKVNGIHKVERIRVRESGPTVFVEATVLIDQTAPLEQAHRIVDDLEERIRTVVDGADVIIHAEPTCLDSALLEDRIRAEAAKIKEIKGVHNIIITDSKVGRLVEFHMEVDSEMSVHDSQKISSQLEKSVRELDLCIATVATHIEPAERPLCPAEDAFVDKSCLEDSINEVSKSFPEIISCDHIIVHRTKSGLKVSMDCIMDPRLNVRIAHDLVTRMENEIRSRNKSIESITIHFRPNE